MKKMIVTANIEFSMENNNGEKSVIKSAANLEVSANNCAIYKQKIDNAAFDCLRMAMEADDTANTVFSNLNKIIKEENESDNKNTFSIIELEGDCITIYININSTIKGTHPTKAFGYAAIKNMPTHLLIALREKGIIPRVIDANIDSKDKDRIIYSSANENMSEKRILDIQRLICSTSIIYISSIALEALKMHGLKLYVENESSNDKVDRGNAPAKPVLVKDETETVNNFAGTAKIKKVKKPMIHLLTTEDAPHGQFSKKLLCISSITEDNISTLKDIQEARNIDAKRFKHLVTIDVDFFRSLTMRCVSLKNKIFENLDDLLTHLCKKNSELFVSLDAIEVLKQAAESRGLFNVDENLLTYKEIINKYLNLEHEAEQIPFGPSPQREQMAKDAAISELENLNRLMAQVGKPRFRGHYAHPYAPFPPVEAAYKRLFAKPSDLDISNVNNLIVESNERDINLLKPRNQGQEDLKKILQDLNYKTRVLLTMFVGVSDASSELQEDLNILITRANFIATREVLNYKLNKEVASIEKIQSLINEMDEMIASLDREVIYLYVPEHRSYIAETLKDTNKENWYFTLGANKTRYLKIKGTEFPKNVLVNKQLKDAILHHIENSKCMHYTTIHNGIGELKDTDTLSALTKDFDIYMRQDDIDAFMEMMKIANIKEAEEALKDMGVRLDNVDIKVDETLSKLTGGNEDEALEFYGAFAKAFKEATSKDTLMSKIVNNPRWNNMERSAGERASIVKIDKNNITEEGDMEVEFLSNVTIECINTEFPDFKLVPEDKVNKLVSIIYQNYNERKLTHFQKDRLIHAILDSNLYMSDKDLEFFLDKKQCENCSKKHTGDFDGNTARLPLEIKDYSLDALKRLTQSLKRFPKSAHFIVFGVNEDTNELLMNDGLYGFPEDLSLYRVCKRKASLFQYLDLGDIILEDLLHAHIYLTQSFVIAVCDKLKIGVKTFQRKIFNYEIGRKYSVDQVIKRHDFDGDRINSYELKEPLQNPTLNEYAPGLKDKVKEVVESLEEELNLTYPISSVIRNYKTTELNFIDIVKRLNMENFNSRFTDTYGIYHYQSDSLLNTNDVYVFLKRNTANDLFRDQKHPLFQQDTKRARITEIAPYKRISVPKNIVQTLHQCGIVFLEKHVGDRGRTPKISLEELSKKPDVKFKNITVKAGDTVSSATGLPINVTYQPTGVTHKIVELTRCRMAAKTLRAKTQEKENMSINAHCARYFEVDMLITLIAKNSLVVQPYKTTSFRREDKIYKIEAIQNAFTEFLDIPIKMLASRTNMYIHEFAIDSICKYFNMTKSEFSKYIFIVSIDAFKVINNAVQEYIVEKNTIGNEPTSMKEELNNKPNFKVKNIKVIAENAVSSAGEPIDLEMITTLESNKIAKAVELRAETKKENMNLWLDPIANLGAAGLELEIDMIIVPSITKNKKSLILSPYATCNENSYGEALKINKIQSTHSEFIDIPRLMLESKSQMFISAYAIVAVQEHFDLKRSEVNNYIFDFGYVKLGEINHISEKVEIKREDIKPDIQLRTLSAWEVKALPEELKSLIIFINDLFKDKETTIKDFNHYATNDAGLCKVSFDSFPNLHIVISKEAHNRIPTAYKKFITKVDSLKAFELDAEGVRQINYHLERNQLPKIVAVQVVSNTLQTKEMSIDSNKLNPEFLDFFRTVCKHAENVKAVTPTVTEYIYNNIVLYESKLAKDLYVALDINVYKALPKNLKRHLRYKTNCFGVDADIIQRVKEAYASGKAAMPVALEIFATLN